MYSIYLRGRRMALIREQNVINKWCVAFSYNNQKEYEYTREAFTTQI